MTPILECVAVRVGRHRWALLDTGDAALAGVTWRLHNGGYACREKQIAGVRKMYLMHRDVLCARKGQQVDHINGDRLDNRRANLRIVTHVQNCTNQTRKRLNTTSRFKGVWWDKHAGRWRAEIKVNGRKRYLGVFKDEQTAQDAYAAASVKLHGAFGKPRVSR